jgi:hypothetical protein
MEQRLRRGLFEAPTAAGHILIDENPHEAAACSINDTTWRDRNNHERHESHEKRNRRLRFLEFFRVLRVFRGSHPRTTRRKSGS